MKNNLFLFSLILTSCFPGCLDAQPWSGVLNPSRAIDWSNAGVVGGIPSGSWPNCTSAQAGVTVPIVAYAGTAQTINNAIAACGAANPNGSVLQLAAGTFTFSVNSQSGQDGGITWYNSTPVNNVVVRGQGANQTFLNFTTYPSEVCNGLAAMICIAGSNNGIGNEENVCDWTSGYSKGSTTITLANCGTTAPGHGSISNLKVGSLLIFDQVDPPSDPGTIWNCGSGACSQSGGPGRTDGPSVGGVSLRSMQQIVTVTQCDGNSTTGHVCSSGTNMTISPGIYMPNWSGGQAPQAWYATIYIHGDGLEDVSISTGQQAVSNNNITMFNASNVWVKGIRSLYGNAAHAVLANVAHASVVNSYFYQSNTHAQQSYGISYDGASDSLIQNNIIQQVTDSAPSNIGSSEGNVTAYNYTVMTVFALQAGFFQQAQYLHGSGDAYGLWEGNISNGFGADNIHGTHHFETWFRSQVTGWQDTCAGSACIYNMVPFALQAGSRYFNLIGNVVGTPGIHTNYQCASLLTGPCPAGSNNQAYAFASNYTFGWTGISGSNNPSPSGFCINPACASTVNYDPQTYAYSMRWGNWDSANAAVQWNSSEVPSSVSPYGNAVPSGHTLPASFYLSAKPSWWGSLPWPGIGPDITGGNVGQCSGGSYPRTPATAGLCTGGTLTTTAYGGAVNANPAMTCALTVMGMPPDGGGGALSFNEASCYGSVQPPPPPSGTAPPTSLSLIVR